MLTTVNKLSSYLYLLQAEPMPEPILLENGDLDVQADNASLAEWSSRSSSFELDLDALHRFIDRTEVLLSDLEVFKPNADEEIQPQYMTLFYDAAKDVFDGDKQMIRTYFRWLYLVIFHKPEGPRWGEFVSIYGRQEFVAMVRTRFANLL